MVLFFISQGIQRVIRHACYVERVRRGIYQVTENGEKYMEII